MKNLSLILNAVLIIAVAILYFKVYGEPSKAVTVAKKTQAANTVTAPVSGASIAYVELDSLNEHISFIKDKRKELEAEQRAIENEWQNSYRGLENQKNDFIRKKGNTMTQEEAEKFQGELLQQQQQIDNRKQTLAQKLSEKSYKAMEDIQAKLRNFLAEYNRDKNFTYILTTGTGLEYLVYKDSSLNITEDVVNGMNDKLKKKAN
jgi:outer membrane protein